MFHRTSHFLYQTVYGGLQNEEIRFRARAFGPRNEKRQENEKEKDIVEDKKASKKAT